jgi:hypothetical protein
MNYVLFDEDEDEGEDDDEDGDGDFFVKLILNFTNLIR